MRVRDVPSVLVLFVVAVVVSVAEGPVVLTVAVEDDPGTVTVTVAVAPLDVAEFVEEGGETGGIPVGNAFVGSFG